MAYKNFLELAKSRRTTYEYSDKKIALAKLNKILEAGRWAPSCTNTQPWHFVVVSNKKTITRLMMSANYGDFHLDPPLIIAIVLVQEKCQGDGFACFRGTDTGVYDSYMSIGMAALNMALEARDLGVDSCILTPTQEKARVVLSVSENDAVPLILGVGYQKKGAFEKRRERILLKEIVSYEKMGGKK